jgi:8-oxo-dGTP pyrophosphatase MutT (NUDIX family)
MAKTLYPSAAELEAYVVSTGLVSADDVGDVDFQSAAEAAVREWEEQTGWLPFLAAAANTSRRYDPPGPNRSGGFTGTLRGGASRLWLGAGIVSSTTPTIVTGYTPTVAGTTLTHEDDFWMGPENADLKGKPWQFVEFSGSQFGGPRSIRITGRFGYSATLGDEVWEAVRLQGALLIAPEIEGIITGGMIEAEEADIRERYGNDPLATFTARWEKRIAAVVNRYKRLVM